MNYKKHSNKIATFNVPSRSNKSPHTVFKPKIIKLHILSGTRGNETEERHSYVPERFLLSLNTNTHNNVSKTVFSKRFVCVCSVIMKNIVSRISDVTRINHDPQKIR
jgi:hypothetical protein